jgi:hypothetical protein
MNYQFLVVVPGKKVCRLGRVMKVDAPYQLKRGISRIGKWPQDAAFEMDKERKTDVGLEDFLGNIEGVLVVSQKAKDLLIQEGVQAVEYLPVKIINHKGRATKEAYYIAHQIDLQDCLDLKKSQYERNDIDPEFISTVEKMVIAEDKIAPNRMLFRMKQFPKVPIIHRKLAQSIKGAGLTGVYFGEIKSYPELE